MRRGLPQPWQWEARNNDWYITVCIGGKRRQKFVARNGTPTEEVNKQAALILGKVQVDTGQVASKVLLLALMQKHLEHVQRQVENKLKKLPEAVRKRKEKKQTFRIRQG